MPRTVAPKPKAPPAAPPSRPRTVADLIARLDGVPAGRIRLEPAPGTATEADLLRVLDEENVTCELVDGTLVEKAMGNEEGRVTFELTYFLAAYLRGRNLGVANGPDGTLRLTSGLLRVPDLSFISWDRLPGRKPPDQPVPVLALDLAVEVLSRSNTKREMARKVREYFASDVRQVWLIDPRKRTARVFTTPRDSILLTEGDSLDGGEVLPGFVLPLRDLFEAAFRGPDA